MNIFQRSLFVEPGKVLGVQLMPLSAFHVYALMLLESPFICEHGTVNEGDIPIALLIMSSRKKDGLKKVERLQNSSFQRQKWRNKLFWRNSLKVAQEIRAHIDSYFDYPDVWEERHVDGKKASRSGAPFPYFLVSLLWLETGVDLETLWDLPWCELTCHQAIREELKGGNQIAQALFDERERNKRKNG